MYGGEIFRVRMWFCIFGDVVISFRKSFLRFTR